MLKKCFFCGSQNVVRNGGYRPGAAGDTRKGPSSRPAVALAILLFIQVPPRFR